MLSHRERFTMALEGKQPPGRVPTFELVFFLTMEVLGKVHPEHRNLKQWGQMSKLDRRLHIEDAARCYIDIARKYDHSAIFVQALPGVRNGESLIAEYIREETGDEYFLMRHGDATLGIPGSGSAMTELAYRLADEPEAIKTEQEEAVARQLAKAEKLAGKGLFDGYALCADYCFNQGPFLGPARFSEFVTPYLAKLIQGYRDLGFYAIKHTDGNIMPILDDLIACNPHALHSLDPQAGVDIAEVKAACGHLLCLCGNVDCGLMQTGTEAEVVASACYALQQGMPGGGYIFSTSNCVYPGMPLERYELILDIWQNEGNYDG